MGKMGVPLRENEEHYTYQNYKNWPADERWEPIDGVWTAPEFVVEILSPPTSRKDLNDKYNLYERSGVREYWVVDPVGKRLQQYLLGSDGRYEVERTFEKLGLVESRVLEGFSLDVGDLWPA